MSICDDCGCNLDLATRQPLEEPERTSSNEQQRQYTLQYAESELNPHAKIECQRCNDNLCAHLMTSVVFRDPKNNESSGEWCARCYALGKISEMVYNIENGVIHIPALMNTLELTNGLIKKYCHLNVPR